MSTAPTSPAPVDFPSPRDGLDTGSVTELVRACDQIRLPHRTAARWAPAPASIQVPDNASSLLNGLGDYGC